MTTPSSNHAPIPNRRRTQRVLLRLPILVVTRGPDGQHVSENAFTMNVSAHGALIQMSTRVEVGQKILCRNPDTLEEQFIRVVHVTPASERKLEVGVEFLRPAPKFWRIAFPPDDWTPKDPEITADTF
ncbi:MAG TPA: PilZ domain-containing protein [Candidatus Acidoferrum sp.]|nr:PilZ domain-containing protein [Candidatus Acidoferrum sp.]